MVSFVIITKIKIFFIPLWIVTTLVRPPYNFRAIAGFSNRLSAGPANPHPNLLTYLRPQPDALKNSTPHLTATYSFPSAK